MKKSYYPWIVVMLLWVVAALNYVDRQVIFSLFPLLQSSLRLTGMQLGMVGTVFLWVYGVVSPFGGYVADRFSRRSVILFSFGIWSVVTLLLGMAQTYTQVLEAQALMGVSEAFYLPAALALISDIHGPATRSRAVGLHQSGLYAGVAMGGITGGWLGQHYGWHRVFFLLGAIGIVYLIALTRGLPEPARSSARKVDDGYSIRFFTSMRELLSNGSFLLLVVANGLTAIAYWCIYAWLALFLFERYRVSLALAGFSSTFYIQAASLVSVLGGGWLADEWSRSKYKARAWTQAIGLFVAGPALFTVAHTGSWQILVASLVVFGVGRGFFDCNLMPVLCQVIRKELRATAYGVFNFTACVCGGLMALIAGVLKDKIGLAASLEISAVCMVAGSLTILLLSMTLRVSEASTGLSTTE